MEAAKDTIVLVNKQDEITGYGEKMEVHRQGLLHRAFSVLIVNSRDQLLLQKELPENTILPACGPMRAAAIPAGTSLPCRALTGACGKKWALIVTLSLL